MARADKYSDEKLANIAKVNTKKNARRKKRKALNRKRLAKDA